MEKKIHLWPKILRERVRLKMKCRKYTPLSKKRHKKNQNSPKETNCTTPQQPHYSYELQSHFNKSKLQATLHRKKFLLLNFLTIYVTDSM